MTFKNLILLPFLAFTFTSYAGPGTEGEELAREYCECLGEDNMKLVQDFVELFDEKGKEGVFANPDAAEKFDPLFTSMVHCEKEGSDNEKAARAKIGMSGEENDQAWSDYMTKASKTGCPLLHELAVRLTPAEEK